MLAFDFYIELDEKSHTVSLQNLPLKLLKITKHNNYYAQPFHAPLKTVDVALHKQQ